MDRTSELEEEVRRLSRTIDDMRGRMARLEGGAGIPVAEEKRSRRNFLRMGAAAAAGALGVAASRVIPAAAANGDPMTVAGSMTGDGSTATTLTSSQFHSTDAAFSSTALTTALGGENFNGPLQARGADDGTVTGPDGLEGFASGPTSFGVWGLSDSGTGVTGQSVIGIGLYARGSGRIRQQAQGFAGDPTPHFLLGPSPMEQIRDSNGVLWIHNQAGAWRRVNSVRVDSTTTPANPFKPLRLVDTRLLGGPKAAGAPPYAFQVTGAGSGDSKIPADAIGVVGNLTATAYSGAGFLAIMPQGVAYNPATDPSSLNFILNQGAIANAFVCGLNPNNGQLQVYVGLHSSHFIIDITAYIQ
jgi:hypothetical protein